MLISSKDNKNIKLLSKLLSSKKARGENGLFVIEGARGCADAAAEHLSGNITLTAVFCTPEAEEMCKEALRLDDVEKFQIAKELADKISEEGNTQGVFAIAEIPERSFDLNSISKNGRYVVLNHLQDPGNLGTLIRTADALGASGVVLTNNCCDLYNPKTVRSAVGSIARTDIFIENDFERVCRIFEEAGIKTFAAVVENGTSVTEQDFSMPCAVVIGNEGNGLTQAHADMCSGKVTIRMKGNANSLNAAVAGAIIMWEMLY